MTTLSLSEGWRSMEVPRSELNLKITLMCGQSFRWKETWAGVIGNSIVVLRQEQDKIIDYKMHPVLGEDEQRKILSDYFQLSHSLKELYPVWSASNHSINALFTKSAASLDGVRILRQAPLECLYSFICSSNNNIGRITKMVESLCSTYGTPLGEVEGHQFFSFPSLQQLEKVDEATLRQKGFGYPLLFKYRAKYIACTTKQLREYEEGWLESLRSKRREEAVEGLTALMGVGRKVADCVSLFSLDKLEVVPVDTHIFSLAKAHMPSIRGKQSLNAKVYDEIGLFFRERFGKLAGWAHTILFAGDLAKFQKDMQKAEKSSANEKPSEQGDEKENSVNNGDKKRKKAQKNTRNKKSKK